jgi:hypothetical protein
VQVNLLQLMSESGGSEMRHVAKTMQTNIFYDRDMFLDKVVHFVRGFDAAKQSKAYELLDFFFCFCFVLFLFVCLFDFYFYITTNIQKSKVPVWIVQSGLELRVLKRKF